MEYPKLLDRITKLEDKITELENKLDDTVHKWVDLFEIWKKRENENHLILLDTLENVNKIVKHIESKKAPSGPSPYL
ncbi:MAG: hypothetical protein ACXAB4_09170 [Candidatus Hodarchaeales archaeon]|jgi:hypothetical protein